MCWPNYSSLPAGRQDCLRFQTGMALDGQGVMCNQVKDLGAVLEPGDLEPAMISAAVRRLGSCTLYLLLNEDDQAAQAVIRFKPGHVCEVSLPDLTLEPVTGSQHGVVVDFAPMQLRVFLLDPEGRLQVAEPPAAACGEAVVPVGWSVCLPDGGLYSLNGERFPDWSELGFPEYSGCMGYQAEFEWPPGAERAVINAPSSTATPRF